MNALFIPLFRAFNRYLKRQCLFKTYKNQKTRKNNSYFGVFCRNPLTLVEVCDIMDIIIFI